MHLLVIHSHWRPGGVRRVVEEALVAMSAETRFDLRGVTLAAGEAPPAVWAQQLQAGCGPQVEIAWRVDR